jgi:hypothetical protein
MFLAEFPDSLFQFLTTSEDTTLIRNRCADLAGSRPAMEVLVDIAYIKLRYFSFHSYLSPQNLPVKAQSCSGIFCQLYPLSAPRVGEEAEAVFTYTLRQHYAHTWHTVRS